MVSQKQNESVADGMTYWHHGWGKNDERLKACDRALYDGVWELLFGGQRCVQEDATVCDAKLEDCWNCFVVMVNDAYHRWNYGDCTPGEKCKWVTSWYFDDNEYALEYERYAKRISVKGILILT